MSDKSKDTDAKQSDASFIQLDNATQKDAASAASAPRRKALVGVLTAACIVLIVVSLGFVHPSASGAWSIDWIVRTVTGESVVTKGATVSGSTAASGKTGAKDSKASGDASSGSKDSDESDSKDDSESSDKDSKEKKSEGKNGKKSDGKSAGQSSGSTGGSDSSGGVSTGDGSSTDGAPASGGGSASTGSQGGSQESGYVTVTVSVTSSAVGNPVSSGGTFTFNKGATPYDALCALGISINARPSSYGTYVAAIGGLAEKEHGGTSGWMYSVNGVTPNTACSNYVLSNGDNVVWYYVTG